MQYSMVPVSGHVLQTSGVTTYERAMNILHFTELLGVSYWVKVYGTETVMVCRRCSQHCWNELQRLLPNQNALFAVSKGMRTVKHCTNKILQFLTGGAD